MGELRAPFPYFGGKSRAADLIWPRFGTVINFVEPFAGSLAVLLACPEIQRPRVETVNDANAFLANSAAGGDNGNANRERLWFSPACLRPGVDTGQLDWTKGL